MYKFKKILIICMIIITFCIFSNSCLAVNIDMNLGSNTMDDTNESITSVTNSEGLNASAQSSTSNVSTYSRNTVSESTSSNSSTIADSLSALPESELGLTNILNILLITVGVVLILLAIAIIIKLRG